MVNALFFTIFILHLTSAGKVILISLDGFRHDYIEKAKDSGKNVSAFEKITELGFRAKETNIVMVSSTFPSHFSLATGRNVETHGLVGNTFWDPELNDSYRYTDATKNLNPNWFTQNGNEPIWLTNQRNGFKSGVFYWPGSDARFNNLMHYVSFGLYSGEPSLRFRIDRVLEWISQPDINFCMLYYNQPDSNGHKYGPNSQEVMQSIEDINDGIAYLMERIKSLKVKPNLVITTDHGMTDVNKDKIVDVAAVLQPDEYLYGVDESPATLGIWTKNGGPTVNEIYGRLTNAKLENADVYLKKDIPTEYHYSNNSRIAPIVVIAHQGYMILSNASRPYSSTLLGMHGYNNSESDMHGFLVAYGPDVSTIGLVNSFYQIDVYPFVCLLLGLKKPNKIDGVPRRVVPFVKNMLSLEDFRNFEKYARGENVDGDAWMPTANWYPLVSLVLTGLMYNL